MAAPAGRLNTNLSRAEWQPEPPQSCPAWWLRPSRTHSRTPVLVFQVMPYSWQLMQVMDRTAACRMMVPAKVV
jgi:hypothetical protein